MADPVLELVPPVSNKADDWNAVIKDAAEKAGLEAPGTAAAATAAAAKKDDTPTVYSATLTVGGKEMEFKGENAEDVLKQYSAAVTASQLAATPAAAAAKVEEPKPVFTEAEMFDIQVGLQKGDTGVLETFITKSGMLDRYLESKGIKVDDLKAATTERQSDKLADRWKEATDAFAAKVKAGEIDYPGGAQNTYLMGMMLAELGLREKPSVESFEAAYAELKKRNMVFPVTAAAKTAAEETAPTVVLKKKEATSSTAVGTHGGNDQRPAPIDANRRFEIDMTTQSVRQASEAYNELIRQGVKPEQISVKQ